MLKVSTLIFRAGSGGARLLRPHFLPPRLTAAVYHDFLRNVLPNLLQDVDLQTRFHLWLMYDGAPPHFHLAVREFLNSVFPEHWVGRGGPTAWPASSLALSPLHFYMWSYLQSTVDAAAVSDLQDLQQRTQNESEMIRTTSGIFQGVRRSLVRRATS